MEQNLSDKKRVDDFMSWALKLGCPVSALPSGAILSRFAKANHASITKIMVHSRPKCGVILFKDNLLLQSLTNSNTFSENHQWQSVDELKNIKKVEKINGQIGELKFCVKQLKSEVEAKKLVLLKKADQLTKAKKNHQINEAKCVQLKQKHAQWTEKIAGEKIFEEMLEKSMVVEITDATTKEEAENMIKKSIKLLDSFYDEIGDCIISNTQRHNVEKNIQNIMAGVPVSALFDAIQCCSESGIKIVDQTLTSALTPNDNHSLKDPVSFAFDAAITKCRMKIYTGHLNTKKLRDEHAIHTEKYFYLYDQYLTKIIEEMKAFNALDIELFAESICSDYLKVHGTCLSNQAISEFHQVKLKNLQRLATERDDLLKGNEVITSELMMLYDTIQKTYNLILDDLIALGNVNRNMKQLQAVSKYIINNFGTKNICNLSSSMSSVVPSITINLVPAEYLNELPMLSDVVSERWKKMPQQISMDIKFQHHKEMLSPFDSLLTSNAVLKELKMNWAWYKAINVATKPLDVDKPFPKFTRAEFLSKNFDIESNKLLKSMDDIKFMYQTGSKTIVEIQKYLEFLFNVSLGSLIPENVMLNHKSFKDYEQEFLCACSIISNSLK